MSAAKLADLNPTLFLDALPPGPPPPTAELDGSLRTRPPFGLAAPGITAPFAEASPGVGGGCMARLEMDGDGEAVEEAATVADAPLAEGRGAAPETTPLVWIPGGMGRFSFGIGGGIGVTVMGAIGAIDSFGCFSLSRRVCVAPAIPTDPGLTTTGRVSCRVAGGSSMVAEDFLAMARVGLWSWWDRSFGRSAVVAMEMRDA